MKHQKILNLLNEAGDPKFVTRKRNIANDQSNANYNVRNGFTYNTEVLKYNLSDYNDAYILVRGDITVASAPATQVSFKNCAPFTKCITKIDRKTIDDAEDLGLIMPMYNIIEYSSNYSKTTGRLWFYSKDEAANFDSDLADNNNFKSFKCKAKLLGNTAVDGANGFLRIATITVP